MKGRKGVEKRKERQITQTSVENNTLSLLFKKKK